MCPQGDDVSGKNTPEHPGPHAKFLDSRKKKPLSWEIMANSENPFLSGAFPPDFSKMDAKAADEAVAGALGLARENIAKIEAVPPENANFENTVRALDRAASLLEEVWNIANHMESVSSSPEMREVLRARDAEVAGFFSSICLNEKLWERVRACNENPGPLGRDARALLDETVKSFLRNGAGLCAQDKERLREADAKLAALTRKFSENALDAHNAFEMRVCDPSELAGLPESAMSLAKKKAREKGLDGWLLTLDAPILGPVLSHCENERLRETLWRAQSGLCEGGKFDNGPTMREIISVRAEKAAILGKENFADFVLEGRMAQSGGNAARFVERLRERMEPHFRREISEIESFAGRSPIEPWNAPYLAEGMRRKNYDFDPEQFRPYLPLGPALKGLFALAERLYGIRITEGTAPAWHPSVMFFDVFDAGGAHMASFYADLFPRKGKRGGAWMNLLRDADAPAPKLGLIACNFNEPSGDAPALLSHDELSTLFHEFGHLLHFMLMDSPERGLRGVAWDFVELPSQIMENWCVKKEVLDTFAAHWKTGEKLPTALFEKFDAAKKFRGATACMRQLSFAKIDLDLHMRPGEMLRGRIEENARAALAPYSQKFTETPHTILPHFTHIFGDPVGYAAGYYSYKWAEALDADAFTRFEKEGLFNPDTGRDFAEKILKPGRAVPPQEAFRNFMGRDPDPEALVRRTV